MAAPTILSVTYADVIGVAVTWQPLSSSSGATGYQLQLYVADQPAGPPTVVQGVATFFATIPGTLVDHQHFTVRICATTAAGAGPFGPPQNVVTGAPAGVTSSYDGTNALLQWEAVGDERVTGYAVTLTSNGATGPTAFTNTNSITLPAPANQTNTVQVQALSDISSGPPTGTTGIITEQVTVMSVVYDGANLRVAWNAAQTPGATYRVELYSGPQLLASYNSSAAQAVFAAALDPTGAYAVQVRVLLPRQQGQLSAPMNVVTALPGLLEVTADAALVSIVLDTSRNRNANGVAGYQAFLYQGSQQVAGPVTAVTEGGVTTALIHFQLQTAYRYSVAVQAVGATPANQAGPLSARTPVIAEAPAGVTSSYDGTNALLQWEAVGDERVTGYAVILTSNGATGPTAFTNTNSITLPAPANQTNTVQVQALSDISSGPPTGTTGIITEQVSVTSVVYDGANLRVAWNAAQTPGATYRVELYSGPQLLASYNSSAAQAVFAAALDPTGAYAVQVRVIRAGAIGPAGPAAKVVAAPVAMASATTAAIIGKTTLQWTGLPNATSYSLQLFVNGLPAGAPTTGLTGTSYTLPNAVSVGAQLSVALAAVIVAGTTTATGPFGTPYQLPTASPADVSVDYNGASLRASWTPTAEATGYTASIFATGAAQPLATAAAAANAGSVTFPPFTADPSSTYQVVVQAMVNADTGPPSAAVPLFVPALFVGNNITNAPCIRPSHSLAFANEDITLYLPDLGAGAALQNLPIPPSSAPGPFTLSANTDSATKTNYPYILSIPSTSSAWTFDENTIRLPLQNAYIAFLQTVETNGATPWGISVLQQAISRAMPQTFQETLYYAYGLDLPNSRIDLRPGMVLRVVINDYIWVGQATAASLSGYTGGAVLDYDISSYLSPGPPARQWTVGFDALLSELAASNAIIVQPPQSSSSSQTAAGIAEVIDLYYAAFRQPFYRLFFPQALISPTGTGTMLTQSNFTLAAAPSYAALTATVNFPTSTNAVAYFRGRVIVKLCIRVFVNGVEQIVPIGTTVQNVLERYAQQIPSAAVAFDGLNLERSRGLAVTQPETSIAAGGSYRIRLDWNHLTLYGPAHDALSLPLLHGDRLTIG